VPAVRGGRRGEVIGAIARVLNVLELALYFRLFFVYSNRRSNPTGPG